MSRDTFKAKGNPPMSQELAAYIADYVNEEIARLSDPIRKYADALNRLVQPDMILKAIDAYEGGAR